MNQLELELDKNWVDIKARLSLEDDMRYSVQCISNTPIAICEYDNTPPSDLTGQIILGDLFVIVRPKDGFNLYARSISTTTARMSVAESAF